MTEFVTLETTRRRKEIIQRRAKINNQLFERNLSNTFINSYTHQIAIPYK